MHEDVNTLDSARPALHDPEARACINVMIEAVRARGFATIDYAREDWGAALHEECFEFAMEDTTD
ncbi:hypothetical protein H9P43_003691 [Blastocladiella emersonii ATCC 22665]|nr:hypothetical protein H9P43_003691 [Blastocladiella emersonii ATCC 22665]